MTDSSRREMEPSKDGSSSGVDDGASVRPIGQGIRSERTRRGWTMAELGALVDLTPQAIGSIERGEADPSINSLRRISQALNVPMFKFLLTDMDRHIVVRRDARVHIKLPTDNLDYELLSSDTNGTLEVLSVRLYAGASTREEPSAHAAEECTVVLRGSVTVEIAGKQIPLEPGDSVTIRGGLPHRFLNTGGSEAELLMALSPSSF
jgi:transcriptional regulator with XRE-family HTH domain